MGQTSITCSSRIINNTSKLWSSTLWKGTHITRDAATTEPTWIQIVQFCRLILDKHAEAEWRQTWHQLCLCWPQCHDVCWPQESGHYGKWPIGLQVLALCRFQASPGWTGHTVAAASWQSALWCSHWRVLQTWVIVIVGHPVTVLGIMCHSLGKLKKSTE